MRPALSVVGFFLLACGGGLELFPDEVYEGEDARRRLEVILGSSLPAAHDVRMVRSTGIDWIVKGDLKITRAEAEPWFAALVLPCDPLPVVAPVEVGVAGDPVPPGAEAHQLECFGRDDLHYNVSLNDSGEPAVVRIEVFSI